MWLLMNGRDCSGCAELGSQHPLSLKHRVWTQCSQNSCSAAQLSPSWLIIAFDHRSSVLRGVGDGEVPGPQTQENLQTTKNQATLRYTVC